MNKKEAEEIIVHLADGINPITGEVLPLDCVCNHPQVIRAFNLCVSILSEGEKQNSKKNQLPNHGKAWTNEEEQRMIELFKNGVSIYEIAKVHQRSKGSIELRLIKLGLLEETVRSAIFYNT